MRITIHQIIMLVNTYFLSIWVVLVSDISKQLQNKKKIEKKIIISEHYINQVNNFVKFIRIKKNRYRNSNVVVV